MSFLRKVSFVREKRAVSSMGVPPAKSSSDSGFDVSSTNYHLCDFGQVT